MPEMILLETEEAMDNKINAFKKECSKVRTGRANPKMLEEVKVEYYGTLTPLPQVGNTSVPIPSQILFKPYDRSIVGDVTKAILAANLGVTPSNEGDQIRINIPALTTERRLSLTKEVKRLGEEAKIQIRNVRRDGNDAIKKLEKSSSISEDDCKGYQEDIQELTNRFTNLVDELVKQKEIDIMSI